MAAWFRRTKNKVLRRRWALRLVDGLAAGRLLDAPCGTGELSRELTQRGHRVWALDRNPTALAERDGIHFDVGDLNRPLPYADGFFDAIVSLEGIEHLESPAVCLGEFARVLRAGGRLVLTTPNVNNVQSRWDYLLTGRFSGFKTLARRATEPPNGPVDWHVTVPYLPTLAYLMVRHGLRIESIDVTMIKRKQWLFLPLALVMWLTARGKPPATLTRQLGSWRLLLGRSLVISAVKDA